jgi:hypothetical protein
MYSINHLQNSAVRGSKLLPVTRVIADETTIYIGVDSSTGPVMFFREQYIKKEVESHCLY